MAFFGARKYDFLNKTGFLKISLMLSNIEKIQIF
jgi:hypothetical protein